MVVKNLIEKIIVILILFCLKGWGIGCKHMNKDLINPDGQSVVKRINPPVGFKSKT